MTNRVLLGDDHLLVREGLRSLLEDIPEVEVVGEASNGRELVRLCQNLHPDIVLMDVAMPELNGVEATRKIVSEFPNIKVIALSMHSGRRTVEEMIKAGAVGYVLKNSAFEELTAALKCVQENKAYISPSVAAIVLEKVAHPDDQTGSPASVLSPREREVLQLLAEGYSAKQISEMLHMGTNTVQTHRRNIMEKLDIHSVAQLTKFAIREGITSPDL
jgi:two-component system response regulator NreC